LVSRLEVFARSAIETAGGRRSAQYRGGSLPLLEISETASVQPLADLDSYFVVVYSVGGREVGLMVSQIVDIVESNAEFDESTFRQPGILGSGIFQTRTTLLVDLYELARNSLPGLIQTDPAHQSKRRILVTDDSPFYRRQIAGFLREQGHEVYEAENGDAGLATLETIPGIDLVLTDVEMPVMDGFELTRRIRSHPELNGIAVVAITSLGGDEALRRGKDVGLDGYIVKLDREKILESVGKFLARGRC